MEPNERMNILEEEVRGLRDILEVARVVVSSLDLDAVLQNILQNAMEIVKMPAGSIALYDERARELTLHAHAGLSEAFVSRRTWRISSAGLTARILGESEPFVIEDTQEVDFFNNTLALAEKIRAVVAVPLRVQEKIVGILYLDDFQPRRIPENRLRLLSILGSFAAMSIDNARLHETMRGLACTDGLTGLYNHRQFKNVFRDELARGVRYGSRLSLVMFDIDDFKAFNDTYGHPVGDRVLVNVAEILQDAFREADTICRYGGEEFIAILPETCLNDALVAAERARRDIEERSNGIDGVRKGVTVSVGVATFPGNGSDAESLLKTVDNLMYRAKEQGKNKVYYEPLSH